MHGFVLAPPPPQRPPNPVAAAADAAERRRDALLDIATASFGLAALAAAPGMARATIGPMPNFPGRYTDPKFPGCKREIVPQAENPLILDVEGQDGNPACQYVDQRFRGEGEKTPWTAIARRDSMDADEIHFDFSSKGGPKDIIAKWDYFGIKFADGSKWQKIGGIRKFRVREGTRLDGALREGFFDNVPLGSVN